MSPGRPYIHEKNTVSVTFAGGHQEYGKDQRTVVLVKRIFNKDDIESLNKIRVESSEFNTRNPLGRVRVRVLETVMNVERLVGIRIRMGWYILKVVLSLLVEFRGSNIAKWGRGNTAQ